MENKTIAQQYHEGLSELAVSLVDSILEVVKFTGNQVVVSASGNPQIVISKDLINNALVSKGIEAKVTGAIFLQGKPEILRKI